MAKKSRNRAGASSARTAAARPARPAQADAAPTGTVHTGTAQLTVPAAAADPATSKTTKNKEAYPGQYLGLPEHGPGSVSSMPRRVVALLIDWLLCTVIALWLTHSPFWTIVIFAVEVVVLTALGGSTVGKRLVGIRTVRMDGRPVGFGWAMVRTAILLTVVPAIITDRDLRGLHDRAANTMVVRI